MAGYGSSCAYEAFRTTSLQLVVQGPNSPTIFAPTLQPANGVQLPPCSPDVPTALSKPAALSLPAADTAATPGGIPDSLLTLFSDLFPEEEAEAAGLPTTSTAAPALDNSPLDVLSLLSLSSTQRPVAQRTARLPLAPHRAPYQPLPPFRPSFGLAPPTTFPLQAPPSSSNVAGTAVLSPRVCRAGLAQQPGRPIIGTLPSLVPASTSSRLAELSEVR